MGGSLSGLAGFSRAHRSFSGRFAGRLTLTVGLAAAVALPLVLGGGTVTATQFCNSSAITINDRAFGSNDPGTATPYPSTLDVSGVPGTTAEVELTLNNVTHGTIGDLDVMLVSPAGQGVIVVSDAGGNATPVSNVTVTFDDDAAGTIGTSGGWPSPSKPIDHDLIADLAYPSPAPTAPASTLPMSTFDGAAPNGTWSLYVVDDSLSSASGTIAGGWCLNILSNATAAATTTTVSSDLNPSNTGQAVTFTATVTSDGSAVGVGDVTFKDGATPLGPPVALDASGQATLTTSALTEGAHAISATYSGTVDFGASNGSISQVVDNATEVNGNQYCNLGAISVGTGAPIVAGSPYPSHILVGGEVGNISELSVMLNNVTHTNPDDLDVLLVGPDGQQLVLVSDAGGSADMSAITLTLDDDAAATLGDATPWGASPVTAQPTNVGTGDSFPAPAPSLDPTPATSLAAFDATSPNGTWSLYVVDDALGETGSIGSWCLTIDLVTGVPTTTSVQSDNNPSQFGESVTFTATVSSGGNPVPTGTIAFYVDNIQVASGVGLNASGHATYTTSTLPAGPHVVMAVYDGTDDFVTSDGSVTQQVDPADTTTLLQSDHNPSVVGEPVTFTATVTSAPGVPTGFITFSVDGAPMDSPTVDANGQATFTTSSLTSGSHDIDATYSGDPNFADSDAITVVQVVNEATPESTTTALLSSLNPSLVGDAVTFTATVTPTGAGATPTGSVTFFIDGSPFGPVALDATGQATFTTGSLPAGSHVVIAHYNGSDAYSQSEGSVTQLVKLRDTTTVVLSSLNPSVFGETVTFTATVSPTSAGPTPTGMVTFFIDGTPDAPVTLDATGQATFTTSTVPVGSHVVSGRFHGDDTFDESEGSVTQVVNELIIADAGGPYAVPEGGALSLDASASTAPAGSSYAWDVNDDGTFGDASGVNPTLTWSDLLALGVDDGPHVYDVRVQVGDGVNIVTSSPAMLTLNNTAPSIVVGDGSGVIGAPISVDFLAADPSPVDEAGSFTYHIDWGDGSPPLTTTGSAGSSFAHTWSAQGIYTVLATATDKDGATSLTDLGVVSVAGTGTVTDPCGSGTALVVRGTPAGDSIDLQRLGTAIRVMLNGTNQGSFSPTARIIVLAGAGDDTVTIDKAIMIPRMVYGESGNDTIVVGKGTSSLLGGDGDDTITGGNGRDILIGGIGADTLRGDHDDDILVAGPTTYDDDNDADRRSLCAIADEWGSGFDYAMRVAHLTGATPGGSNGSTLLTPGATLSNDTAVDGLTGGKGRDWFLLNVSGGGPLDTSDAVTNETRTDL